MNSSLFNTYFAFVLLFDIVTCHEQQKLHLDDSHATFPKILHRRRAITFHCVLSTFQKRPKNVCVFSWNVTAIFEKLSCKKQRNAAERMLYLVSWENIQRNDRVGSTQNHVMFRAVKWLFSQDWMGKHGHLPTSMILKQATTNLGKSESKKNTEFQVWS